MAKFTLDDLMKPEPRPDEYEVWDNQPGGHVVERWQEDGVKYVGVEFKHSPGFLYTYLQGSK